MTGARSIVFIGRPDWHARQLAAAFAKAGVEPVLLSLRHCGFTGTPGGARLRLPSFEDELPLGAFVRSISAGSFEQVTLRLGVLHALAALGRGQTCWVDDDEIAHSRPTDALRPITGFLSGAIPFRTG